jgi:hypothetical protein
VIGEPNRDDNRFFYPLHPERNRAIGARHWADHPVRPLGDHDGLPDRQRHS